MDHSAIMPILEQVSLWPAPVCVKYAEYGTELHKYIGNYETIET